MTTTTNRFILKLVLFILVTTTLFTSILSNTIISVDTNTEDTITSKNGFKFYTVKLPNIDEHNYMHISVRESEGKDNMDFADPDLFVSKSNHQPKSKEDSDFSSFSFGDEFLTIPNVKANETYFIGVFCNKKCAFELEIELAREFEIKKDKLYKFVVPRHTEIDLKFYQEKTKYTSFEFSGYSTMLKDFEMLIQKKKSSRNGK